MTSKNNLKTKLERTLSLNEQMQSQLMLMREKLERLLSNVKDTYQTNEVLLQEGILRPRCKGVGIKGAYLKGGTFYLKGNMFFKDIKCRNCPNNLDYERRKMENEMFPMDLNLKSRHVWSTPDKQGIILGIKEQIIDYLKQPSKVYGKKNKELDSEKLAKLLNMISDDFRIDWDYISSHNLQHRHSAKTCEAIWNLFLHPSLKRSAWTEEENNILLEAAKKHNFQNWQAIAKEVGQRSDFQCFVQYQSKVCLMLPESYTKWSKEDDKRLLDVIARNTVNGIINWSNVNAYFPHKAKTTLHSRYNFTLNPDIRRYSQFTPEEDLLLIAAVKEYGKKFSCIPRSLFPNRSLTQLRGHYNNVLSKRHKTHSWSLEDDIKLMDFVTEKGTKAWLECEKYLNERHSRASCRTRFTTIKKYLEKYPDSTIENLPRKQMKPTNSININNWKEKVDELSLNTNDEKPNSIPKKQKVDKGKLHKRKRNKLKKSEENVANITDKEISAKNMHQTGEKMLESIEEIVRKSGSIKPKIVEAKSKPYINRLRTIEVNNYNYFKYSYNFEMVRHPCHNIQITDDDDFRIVLSALNPRISLSSQNSEFDTNISRIDMKNVMRSNPNLSNCGTLQLLPPSWSTAMGFRALCINTADISTKYLSHDLANDSENDYVRKFRDRLHFIFYSTALLSRLDPGMVGITAVEPEEYLPTPFKRKRSCCINDKEEFPTNKHKRSDCIENIKTEFES